MKTIKELLLEVNPEAAKMGLKFAGWGKWKDASGKITHKSQGGKIVPIGADDTGAPAPAEPAPAAKPAPAPQKPQPEPKAEPKQAKQAEPAKSAETKKAASEVFTPERLSNFMKLSAKVADLKTQLEEASKEYGDETQVMLDEFDRTNQKSVKVEEFVARVARKQTLRTTQSYQTGYQFLLDKANDELKKAAEAALKATENISYIRGKVDVTKSEPVQEEGEPVGDVKQISDTAASEMKQANDNLDALLMLMQIMISKGEVKETGNTSLPGYTVDTSVPKERTPAGYFDRNGVMKKETDDDEADVEANGRASVKGMADKDRWKKAFKETDDDIDDDEWIQAYRGRKPAVEGGPGSGVKGHKTAQQSSAKIDSAIKQTINNSDFVKAARYGDLTSQDLYDAARDIMDVSGLDEFDDEKEYRKVYKNVWKKLKAASKE